MTVVRISFHGGCEIGKLQTLDRIVHMVIVDDGVIRKMQFPVSTSMSIENDEMIQF